MTAVSIKTPRIDKRLVAPILAVILLAACVGAAHAGAGGSEFDDVWMTLRDWTQGTLGRIVCGAMILVGVTGGIARQSLLPFATGVGGGIGLYNAPEVIESVMSATLQQAPAINSVVSLTNGLGM